MAKKKKSKKGKKIGKSTVINKKDFKNNPAKKNQVNEKLIFVLVFLVIFSLSYYIGVRFISSREGGEINYSDFLNFEKVIIEENEFYKTTFIDYRGDKFDYFLSNSPEELSTIQISGEIDLSRNLYFFAETRLEDCPYFHKLYVNLLSVPLFQISGVSNEMRRLEKEDLPKFEGENNTIVLIRRAGFFEKSQIKQLENNKYEIKVKNCDLSSVFEKFVLEAYINYKFD
jgi:hypothetical protein